MSKEKSNLDTDEKIKSSPSSPRKKTHASPRVGSSSDEGQTVEEVLEKAVQRRSGSVRGSIVQSLSRNSQDKSAEPEVQDPKSEDHQQEDQPENTVEPSVSNTAEPSRSKRASMNPVVEAPRRSNAAEANAGGAPRKSVRLSLAPDSGGPPPVTLTAERRTLVTSYQAKEFNPDEEERIATAIQELEKSLHAMAEAQQERLSNSSGGKKSTSSDRRSTNTQLQNAVADEPTQDTQALEVSEEDCEPAEEVPFMSAFLDTILGNDQLPCNVCDQPPEALDGSVDLGYEEFMFKTIDLVNDILKQLVQFVLEKVEKAKSPSP